MCSGKVLHSALVFVVGMQLLGCGGDSTGPGTDAVTSVVVTPGTHTFTALGDTRQFSAVAKNAAGATITGKTFTWSSSNTSAATVDAGGLVTAMGNGSATITATSEGRSDDAGITVAQQAQSVVVTPDASVLWALGDTHRFSAEAEDGNGNIISPAPFDWTSSDEGVATVDATGLATAQGPGQATITVEVDGVIDSAELEVRPLTSVTTGDNFTCGVTAGGSAYCWGFNSNGQLGDGSTTDQTAPIAVTGGHIFTNVDGGGLHACGVTTDGDVYCWGDNASGQLGDGTTVDRTAPVRVTSAFNFASVSASSSHTCAVTTGSGAFCWGANSDGQLGDGTFTDRHLPAQVLGLSFTNVSTGPWHTCGVTPGQAAYCWGRDSSGQLGDGKATGNEDVPVPVSGGHKFSTVSAGGLFTCGRTTVGSVYCWGRNSDGQLGDGTTTDRLVPTAVAGSFASLRTGSIHTCGVATDESALCWGWNFHGQLGDATTTGRTAPVAVSGDLSFAELSAGFAHTCGVLANGSAYCWGFNGTGQLGDGTTTQRHTPVRVIFP
jgi:alpha-tubulin suppressor-like RCC1 family protein